MIIRTRRRITHRQYLEEMEAKHGPLEEFYQNALAGKTSRPLAEEWKWVASHPERLEERLTATHAVVFGEMEAMLRLLSPERLRILDYLSTHASDAPRSINELARKLDRDYKNVYDDVHDLADVGALDLQRVGRRIVPHPVIVDIQFKLGRDETDAASPA